jgi:hypothetical protein
MGVFCCRNKAVRFSGGQKPGKQDAYAKMNELIGMRERRTRYRAMIALCAWGTMKEITEAGLGVLGDVG